MSASRSLRAVLDAVERALTDAASPTDEIGLDARREARLLVSAVLECEPGDLVRARDHLVPEAQDQAIEAALARRLRGEPLAYAVGNAPFRHLVLAVDARVLIPRPETEVVVEEALRATRAQPGGVAVDIGTGSGAIALALATEGRFDRVIATDISRDALTVAAANADAIRPSTPVEFRLGADLAPLAGLQARVIVSNPPYIAYEEAAALPASVRNWEPATALFAADGGMARYDALLAGAATVLEPDGCLVLEVDARRAEETAARARQWGWREVRIIRDLAGRDRVLVAKSPAHGPSAGAVAASSAGISTVSSATGPEARTHA